ncbi:MAG: hypothetical protein IH852_10670 [Bacteroidetes bacterium]|nr:hypothetical protein [Bacteroidota bacterium]
MTDIDNLKKAIIDICKGKHGESVLRAVNNKRDYKEIAAKAQCRSNQSSSLLNKAETFGLIKKEGNVWKKTPEFRHLQINQVLRDASLDSSTEKKIKVKKRTKKTNTDHIKKDIISYFLIHFSEVPHPFSDSLEKIDVKLLQKAAEELFNNLECDGPKRLKGLSNRFYESFSAYFSSDRIKKSEFINNFRNLVNCFEPYVKKVAAIKTQNPEEAKPSLNKNMISKVVSFNSNLNNNTDSYWHEKPIHEASIRIIFPYRHIESHEARDYTLHEMERIIFYLFASIIFINLDY